MNNQEVRFNESGYQIKECLECKRDININSFYDDQYCITCHIDINDVKMWNLTDGDFNDIYSNIVIKGTGKQVDKYLKTLFTEYDKDDIEDLNTDGFGYMVYYPEEIDPETNEPYEDQEIRIEYYAEAREIENYDPNYDGSISFDLNNEDGF